MESHVSLYMAIRIPYDDGMSAKTPEPPLPQILGCTVTRERDGLMRVKHNITSDTLTADTDERATIAGVILRLTATWHSAAEVVRFRTGDLP